MEVTRVAVVGAGTMGAGIAQVVAQAGIPVTIIDRDESILEEALSRIRIALDRAVERERIGQDEADVALSVIETDSLLESAGDVNLVIEAVPESIRTKADVFRRLDEACGSETIIASNTSSISITELGSNTERPGKVVGLHFFNPVPVMSLVEVVRGERTNDDTLRTAMDFAQRVGKTPVVVRDLPGFVSNRILLPMINEAIFVLMEGVASAEDIDRVMKLGMRHPMGPLELADMIGLDVCLDILEVLHRDLGDPKYRPCPILRQKVAAGKLGQKSGEGFHDY